LDAFAVGDDIFGIESTQPEDAPRMMVDKIIPQNDTFEFIVELRLNYKVNQTHVELIASRD
jgi:hypothetical protein